MKILKHGRKTPEGYLFDGVLAESLDDGYTIRLSCDRVSLTLFFHNKHQFDGRNAKAIDALVKRLQKLDQRH